VAYHPCSEHCKALIMLVFTDSNKHCTVYVFDSNIPGQYVLELIDKDTGDTIRSVRIDSTESEAIERTMKWMENY
jgi:predicted adenine nucleotide alpha hydrolase (AANH) superfamily ATPase